MKFYKLSLLLLSLLSLPISTQSASKKLNTDTPVLNLELTRELVLNWNPKSKPKAEDFISAASGLVKRQDTFYFISDDEPYLFYFSETNPNIKSLKLFEPVTTNAEKKKVEKADFESLMTFNQDQWPPYGALVVWPSASNSNRMKAVTIPFKGNGQLDKPLVADILPLASRLLPHVKIMNMEGLLAEGQKVYLFQRGNAKKSKNGIAELPLNDFVKGLKTGDWSGKLKFESVQLGKLNGVKLGFADASYSSYGLLALATAEDTASAIGNGHIHGTVLVRIAGKKSEILAKFEPRTKLEGLHIQETQDGLELFLVEDADDSEKPSRFFKAKILKSQLEAIKTH